jgi:hypothetical protein
VGAAIERIIGFDAMTDDLAPTMVANRGQLMNRALEAVERMFCLGRDNFKR